MCNICELMKLMCDALLPFYIVFMLLLLLYVIHIYVCAGVMVPIR
jgi:hypothetical protein